ncbi:hypothetical protein [Sessilibacter sp. MAH4]
MNKKSKNLILSKLRRPALSHSPSGKADVFFGEDQLANILCISEHGIDYTNNAEEKNSIRFDEMDTNYNLPDKIYVGHRALLSSPPTIQFFDEKNTLFEFQSKKTAHDLIEELSRLNIWTIDVD